MRVVVSFALVLPGVSLHLVVVASYYLLLSSLFFTSLQRILHRFIIDTYTSCSFCTYRKAIIFSSRRIYVEFESIVGFSGTSFGVSTIYLALAVAKAKAAYGKEGTVIATEKEEHKAEKARSYWKQCGSVVESQIDLRVGDLLETLKKDVPVVDLLLLDSKWASFLVDGRADTGVEQFGPLSRCRLSRL